MTNRLEEISDRQGRIIEEHDFLAGEISELSRDHVNYRSTDEYFKLKQEQEDLLQEHRVLEAERDLLESEA